MTDITEILTVADHFDIAGRRAGTMTGFEPSSVGAPEDIQRYRTKVLSP
jgi:hypothetical protein